MPYFQVFQSVNKDGPYLWYWSLLEKRGHMYHISDGYETIGLCLQHLLIDGPKQMSTLLQSYKDVKKQLGEAMDLEGGEGLGNR